LQHVQARRALAQAARATQALGLNRGTSGNLSVRVRGGLLVTPSAIPYDALTPAQVVVLDAAGRPAPAQLRPSSEWRFHRDILAARAEVNAVVHTHSPYATALACLREDLPAFHYTVAVAGGADVRCARYATFGTQALSDAVLAALADREACLLANHGLIALGADLPAAVALAHELEALCQQYLIARAAGRPLLLGAAEMDAVRAGFAQYRRPNPAPRSRRTRRSTP
jgi:L-fuculose-phosphate aldolase